MSSSYRRSLDKWLSNLDVKADNVLDVGGSQLPVKGRTKSWEVKEYLIADLSKPHVDSPKPDIEIDLNFINVPAEYVGFADVVFCLEVMDYVYNPIFAFYSLAALLKPGGTAWVSFPTFYPTHQPIEDDALCYKEGAIRKLSKLVDLEIVQMIRRRPETNMIEQLWKTERMRAAHGYDHNFLGWIVEFRK